MGQNGISGEWGHNPLPWWDESDGDEQLCGCAQYGCIETYLNGLALSRDYKCITSIELDAEAIAGIAGSGDKNAVTAIGRYSKRLAKALAGVINLLDLIILVNSILY